jgi:hypothetical protein
MLAAEGVEASARERFSGAHAAEVASPRYERLPGSRCRSTSARRRHARGSRMGRRLRSLRRAAPILDSGVVETTGKLRISAQLVRVFLLVAVLSHSRRIFGKAFLNRRR